MPVSHQKKVVAKPKDKPSAPAKSKSLFTIYGDDDFLVAEEARQIIASLTPKGSSEFSLETVDGLAANQAEAAAIFKKLFEALQSQSFFATEKIIWWRNTNLLGASQTATASGAAEYLASLNEILVKGLPEGVALVITASEFDGRKQIAKTLEKAGKVISFKTDPYKQQENQARSLDFVRETASQLGKKLNEETALLLVEMTGGDSRTIHSELEKLAAYVADQPTIREEDIHTIGSWRPGGIVWDLPDAVGERDLGKVLSKLDNLLFIGEAPIALLFAIIARIRLLLLLSALVDKKLLRVGGDYVPFKSQMEKLPAEVLENLPKDKKLNPLASHPYVLWKASSGVSHYTKAELQQALALLLKCNERMVSSGGDPQSILQETLLKICMKP